MCSWLLCEAFFGGMVAGLYHWGVPKNVDMLK
jgi:hypothetical protein